MMPTEIPDFFVIVAIFLVFVWVIGSL